LNAACEGLPFEQQLLDQINPRITFSRSGKKVGILELQLGHQGGVSDCIETPRSYVANSFHRSERLPICGGYRFLIIRSAAQNTPPKPSKTFLPISGEVEAIKVHYLVPRRYEVVKELFLRVLTSVDFR
jgi:hypothetical protein